ncbi:MAG: Panacea domain-containing protein [Thermoplasmata archaeon]|nr:Panacea domain-containing protein [Thermoplasmata archaeon]
MSISKNDKLVNALLYVIEEFPEIGRTRLMKFVFFVDLINYNENQYTLLEDEYKRMSWGPVPIKSFTLTGFSNPFFDVEEEQLTPEKKRFLFPLKRKCNRDIFNDNEIHLFNTVIRLFRKMSAEQISEFTHKFDLWRSLEDQQTISLDYFKLDDYEYDQLMSLFAYDEAISCCESSAPYYEDDIEPFSNKTLVTSQ